MIAESGGWRAEHCVGPPGVGTLLLKPLRHVTRVAELTPEWRFSRAFSEANDGPRTRDLRLGKPTLYQLSYVRDPGDSNGPRPDRSPGPRGGPAPVRTGALYHRWPMRKFVIPGAILAAAVALIVLLTFGVSNHADTGSLDVRVARGDFPLAPDYHAQLPLLGTDRTADLASFHNRVVVVNMYASWCTDCRLESPLLSREESVLRRHGATLVGITYEDSSSSTEAFNHQLHLHYPVLRDVNSGLVHAFGTYAVPETFVINRTGHIQAIRREPVTRQWFDTVVMPILQAQRS